MSIRSNIKDYITDFMGLAIWCLTGAMIYLNRADWLWDGVAGMIIGGIFFLLPDNLLAELLKKFINKKIK